MIVPVAIAASLEMESQSRAAAPSTCPSTNLCVYTAVNYNPIYARSNIYYSNTDWSYYPLPVLNQDFSWFNNGTANVCVYHGDWGVVGSHFLTVPLSSGTGYVTSNWWPGPLPNGILGESNKWIGSDPCSAHP